MNQKYVQVCKMCRKEFMHIPEYDKKYPGCNNCPECLDKLDKMLDDMIEPLKKLFEMLLEE